METITIVGVLYILISILTGSFNGFCFVIIGGLFIGAIILTLTDNESPEDELRREILREESKRATRLQRDELKRRIREELEQEYLNKLNKESSNRVTNHINNQEEN